VPAGAVFRGFAPGTGRWTLNVARRLKAVRWTVFYVLPEAPLEAQLEDYAPRLDEQGKQFLGRIRASAQRMGALIDDLLKLSRVTRSELNLTTVDLSQLARDIAAELKSRDADRQVELVIEDGLTAEGDAQLLKVALENLISNTWKFTSKRGLARIEVGRAAAADGRPAFFVRDNGAGFDTRYAARLFGAFQRLHSMTEFPGTGIGLATVQRVMRRHKGWPGRRPRWTRAPPSSSRFNRDKGDCHDE
jgi:light-regulated signal transduction histidine kinase (bacteriophytochrome)